MYTARLENDNNGNDYNLNDSNRWVCLKITGLAPVAAQINMATAAGLDGARLNSTRLEPRNIVILLKLEGDIERNRQLLESSFYTKAPVTFYFDNDHRSVKIQGVVESFECDLFSEMETVQISIICPDPYFLDQAAGSVAMNNSTVKNLPFVPEFDTGLGITVYIAHALDSVTVINYYQNTHIKVSYAFLADDRLKINTRRGHKSVTLIRNGESINLFGNISDDSTFIQAGPGGASYTYRINDGTTYLGYASVYIVCSRMYYGV